MKKLFDPKKQLFTKMTPAMLVKYCQKYPLDSQAEGIKDLRTKQNILSFQECISDLDEQSKQTLNTFINDILDNKKKLYVFSLLNFLYPILNKDDHPRRERLENALDELDHFFQLPLSKSNIALLKQTAAVPEKEQENQPKSQPFSLRRFLFGHKRSK